MGDGFHGMGWTPYFFISPDLNSYGMSSFEILAKLSIYNVLTRTIYINLF